MASLDTSRAIYRTVTLTSALGQTLASLFGSVATWSDARATRKALGGLTDRELDDIGLVRGDIEDLARRV